MIFCDSSEVIWDILDNADDIRNIAIMVPFDRDADVVCHILQASGILYGLYYTYTSKDIDYIESGELLHDMEQLHPAVAVLKPQFFVKKNFGIVSTSGSQKCDWSSNSKLSPGRCMTIHY